MTDKVILQKAIERAEKNGHRIIKWWGENKTGKIPLVKSGSLLISISNFLIAQDRYEVLIFNHDFAKAFFGEERVNISEDGRYNYIKWQYHLQQLAIAENRLEYLKRFL